MAVDPNQLAQQDSDFVKQAGAANQAGEEKQAQAEPSFLQKWVTDPVGRVTTQALDSAVSAADTMYDSEPGKKVRDVAAGAITGMTNIADAAHSFGQAVVKDQTRSTYDRMLDVADPAQAIREQHFADGNSAPLPRDEAKEQLDNFSRNSAYAKPAPQGGYLTHLNPRDEAQFQTWVKGKKVPFDPSQTADYDMRGFWQAGQRGDPTATTAMNSNDGQTHYPDYWKTPYHRSFSAESQWAAPGAPSWNDKDQLVTPDGKVTFDEPQYVASQKASQQPQTSIWDHAKGAILDFRDAVAVQDPTLADNLTQSVAQLALPFSGYSRALSGLHGVASMVAGGALTDATALGPHDMRMADMIALGRHTEGKLGDALRTLAPDGSALNAYVNFLTDRGNESEAEGRFKNVLDGFGANLIATPLIHGAAMVLKQGAAGLRSAVEAGASKLSDLIPKVDDSPLPVRSPVEQYEEAMRAKNVPLQNGAPVPQQPAAAMEKLNTPDTPAEHSAALADTRTKLAEVHATGEDQPISKVVSQLANNVDWKASPDNLHFKSVLTQLDGLGMPTKFTTPTAGAHAEMKNVYGSYDPAADTIAIHSAALQGDDQLLMHTIAHEATHAATMKALEDPANGYLRRGITNLMQDATDTKAVKALSEQDRYAFKDGKPSEFVAEAFANPRLRQALKTEGLWPEVEDYIERLLKPATGVAIAGGITQENWNDPGFRKFFTKIIEGPGLVSEKNGA